MAVPVRTYGDGILIIDGDYVRGEDAIAASGLSGSVLNLRGGNGDGVGDAGGVLIDGGAPGASSGADGGSVTLQATDSAAAGAGLGGNVVLIPGRGLGVGATDGLVRIDSSSPDTSPLLQLDNSDGTNGVVADVLAGDQDPSVAGISARKGSIYIRNAAGATVGSVWVNTSTTDPGTTWTDVTAGGGGSTWADALAAGATTGGTSPIISVGDDIIGVDTSGSDASDYTVRAGNHTAATGSFTGDDLTVSGGSNLSSSNGARGGHLVIAGGDNLVATGATGGDLTCRAGSGGIGGEAIFAGGQSVGANAGGAATFQGGDNTDTGRGGNTVVRGGDCVGGSGSDPGGTLELRGGNARGTGAAATTTIRPGQPGGTTGTTGNIEINTDITVAGTDRETGDINIRTGDSARNSSLSLTGEILLQTGTHTGTGSSGPITIETGDSVNQIGDITLRTGTTSSGGASDPAGDLIFITGDRTNTGSDSNSRAGNVTFTLGTSSNPNTTGPGGSFTVTGGPSDATSANGRGGSVSITAGVYSGGVAGGLAGSTTIAGGASTGASGNGGGLSLLSGQGSGNNAVPGDIDITGASGPVGATGARGADIAIDGGNGGSTGRGGDITVAGGLAGTSNSNGGSVTLTARARTGVGTDGNISLQTTRSGTTDDATVSIDTENGSFAGSEWHHMTVGAEALTTTGTTTVLAIGGPSVNGQNLKLRVWVTAQQTTTNTVRLSQILERSFYRSGGTTTAFTADHQNSIINEGGWLIGDVVTTSISGSTINVQITAPTLENSNWMLQVEWQRGGMAA